MAQPHKRRLIQNSRRKLIARWYHKKWQEIRSELIATLQDHKTLPDEFATSLMSEHGSSPRLDLRCINLSGESLDGIDLSRANLQGANLARCSLKKAKLVEADLRDTLLRNTDLTDADLRGANLADAILENTILYGTKLDGTYIARSTIIAGSTELPSSISRSQASHKFADRLTNSRFESREE